MNSTLAAAASTDSLIGLTLRERSFCDITIKSQRDISL